MKLYLLFALALNLILFLCYRACRRRRKARRIMERLNF